MGRWTGLMETGMSVIREEDENTHSRKVIGSDLIRVESVLKCVSPQALRSRVGCEFHESTLPARFPHGYSAQQVSGT